MDEKKYNIVEGFNLIAPAYDLANDAMTLGLHRRWRGQLCKRVAKDLRKGARLLDIATGTGDVLFELADLRPDLELLGVDPSAGMLAQARKKHEEKKVHQLKRLDFCQEDARNLRLDDSEFDAVTISWGIRNIRPMTEAFSEIKRVLRPGGRLYILESGQPELKPVRLFYQYYARLLPFIGGRISKYRPAYQYYTSSVNSFPSGSEFVAQLHEAGFVQPESTALAGGIVYLYSAAVPG